MPNKMITRNLFLWSVLAFTCLGIAVQLLGIDLPLVRLIFGIPIVVFLPGFALMNLMLPNHRPTEITILVASVGLSLAITVVGGFLLNVTPSGIEPRGWTVLLGGITLIAGLAGVVNPGLELLPIHINWRFVLICVLSILVAGIAFLISYRNAQEAALPHLTEMWLLPTTDAVSESRSFEVGINNKDTSSISYRLVVQVDQSTYREWPAILLGPNETWKTTFALSVGQLPRSKIEALLYRLDNGAVYRQVWLWGPGTKEPSNGTESASGS